MVVSEVKPEDVLASIGGCGRFQIVLSVVVHVIKTVVCWSFFLLIFAVKVPKWVCLDSVTNSNESMSVVLPSHGNWNVSGFKSCEIGNDTKCTSFGFDRTLQTVSVEFDLVCDSAWVPATIASIQVSGVLLSNIVGGHIADILGRKKPFFLSLLIISISNIVTAFSTSWVMFAVCRFFMGLGCGFFLTVQYSLLTEFTLPKWRSWVIGFPSWPMEACIFVLLSWAIHNWKHLSLMIGLLAIPCMASWWMIPESFRWYISHDRSDDAKGVITVVAKYNKHPLEDLASLRLAGISSKKTSHKLTVFSLFKTKKLAKVTLLAMSIWFCMGFVGYGINFAVPSLSGNLYINMFLFSVLAIPSKFVGVLFQNKFGRKAAIILIYCTVIAAATTAGVMYYIDTEARGVVVLGMSLICDAMNAAAWGSVQTITIEMYPTAIRNIGFGFLSVFGRTGALIGPQFVFLNTKIPGLLFFACAGFSAVAVLATLGLPETVKTNLKDKIDPGINTDLELIEKTKANNKY